MAAQRTPPAQRVHELLPEAEQRRFMAHLERVRRQVGDRLPREIIYPLAAFRWITRKHSESDPRRPEFPAWAPKFPATPLLRVEHPSLKGLTVYIKDESHNALSGTHKDRMAWEAALFQYQEIERRLRTGKNGGIPQWSIISQGNALTALARKAALMGLPKINALVDERMGEEKIDRLKREHANVFTAPLGRKKLDSDDVLALTNNRNGLDLTMGKFKAELGRRNYDWMVFEVLNARPTHVVVPYGTGELFDNVWQQYSKVLAERLPDARLLVARSRLPKLHLVGVTAEPGSPADKLGANFLPGSSKEEYAAQHANVVTQNIRAGILGEQSGIHTVTERDLSEAKRLMGQMGIQAEFSGAAGLAWLLKHRREIKPGSRVVIVNTGKGIVED